MKVDTENIVAIGEVAKQGGLSKLIAHAEGGRDMLFMRGSKPAAALVSVERINRLEALEALAEDFGLYALALSRVVTDNGNRTSFDDALKIFGLAHDDLDAADAEDEG